MYLAEEYIKFEKTAGPNTTVDDFFDHCSIPTHQRGDFMFAAIMKQVLELKEEKVILKGAKLCLMGTLLKSKATSVNG